VLRQAFETSIPDFEHPESSWAKGSNFFRISLLKPVLFCLVRDSLELLLALLINKTVVSLGASIKNYIVTWLVGVLVLLMTFRMSTTGRNLKQKHFPCP
jgi:hypothetical protein